MKGWRRNFASKRGLLMHTSEGIASSSSDESYKHPLSIDRAHENAMSSTQPAYEQFMTDFAWGEYGKTVIHLSASELAKANAVWNTQLNGNTEQTYRSWSGKSGRSFYK